MKLFENIKKIFNNLVDPWQFPEDQNNNMTKQEIPIDVQRNNNPLNYYVQDILDVTWNGDKFYNSFGYTKNFTWIDYYTLRKRSVQLFKENQYCKGLIRRLITNEIHKGLNLEAAPIYELIGLTEDQAIEWAENIETDWKLFGKDAYICDWNKINNLPKIEEELRQTSLISGDCLVVLRVNPKTGLPAIELIDGCHVMTPINYEPRKGNYLKHGIEFNAQGRQVAYHVYVEKKNGIGYEYKRIPATGEKSGRRIAWMVYGSDKLLDECRGEPILANMLYMLKELDRYRDAETRAAVVNAIIPMFIKKTEKGVGTQPIGAGAVRRETATVTDDDGTTRDYKITKNLPGQVLDELAYGEEPVSLNTQRPNVNFAKFEEAIIDVFAWTLELPPEIVRLNFKNNFSASRQANNELAIYLDKRNHKMGEEFLQPIYEEFIIAELINGDIQAKGLLEAWINDDWRIYNSWMNAEWTGLSRPSVDAYKDAMTSELLIKNRLSTYDLEARKNSGLRFRTIVQKQKKEKEMMQKAGLSPAADEDVSGIPIEDSSYSDKNKKEEDNDKDMQ